ncbi:MAG TPA: ABC transporter substrate-binding protein [Burkholderiaceae bacterium]
MNKTWLGAAALMHFLAYPFAALAEDGISDNEIMLGQTVGLTGLVADPVKETNEGANLFFDAVNGNGGVNGRKVKLVTIDDKFDPELAKANARTLIERQHVFALFQGRGTPHTEAILPLLAQYRVPLIAPGSGATVLREPVNKWVFNIRAKYQDEVIDAVRVFAAMGIRNIGLISVDDDFGRDGMEGFKRAMKMFDLTPNAIVTYGRVGSDYAATAAEATRSNPQALIVISSSRNTVELVKALHTSGNRAQIMTLSNNSSESFAREIHEIGQDIIVSQIVPAPNSSTPLGREFETAARKAGVPVSYAALEGYVNAKVLVEGLRRAGHNPTREGLVHALESMDAFDVGGMVISYGHNDHSGSKYVDLTILDKRGRFIH